VIIAKGQVCVNRFLHLLLQFILIKMQIS